MSMRYEYCIGCDTCKMIKGKLLKKNKNALFMYISHIIKERYIYSILFTSLYVQSYLISVDNPRSGFTASFSLGGG